MTRPLPPSPPQTPSYYDFQACTPPSYSFLGAYHAPLYLTLSFRLSLTVRLFSFISYTYIKRLSKFLEVATQNIMYGHKIWGASPSFTTCSCHVHGMFTTCSRHVNNIFMTCPIPSSHLPSPHDMWWTECSPHVHHLFTACSTCYCSRKIPF